MYKDRSVRLRFFLTSFSYTNAFTSTGPEPITPIPLTPFMVFRGAEHLASAPSTSLVAGQRIICTKYRTSHPSCSTYIPTQARNGVRDDVTPPNNFFLSITCVTSRPPPANPIPPDYHLRTPVLPSTSSISSSFRSHTQTQTTSNTTRNSGPTSPVDDESYEGS
jgi:hypothetical protein